MTNLTPGCNADPGGLPTAQAVVAALTTAGHAPVFECSGGNVYTVFVPAGDDEVAVGPFLDDGTPAEDALYVGEDAYKVDGRWAHDMVVTAVNTCVRKAVAR